MAVYLFSAFGELSAESMEDIYDKWNSLSITADEEHIVGIDNSLLDVGKEATKHGVVGKLLTDKTFNKRVFKSTMAHVWNIPRGLEIKEVEDNLFIFYFDHEDDKSKVLDGEPWLFDKSLLVLKDIAEMDSMQGECLTHTKLWVQFHGLSRQRFLLYWVCILVRRLVQA